MSVPKPSNKIFLPKECLDEILENIHTDDIRSLFSCLLVNRHWCRLVIPFLYKSPLPNLATKTSQTYFINTLVKCMSQGERRSLYRSQIPIAFSKSRPLFTYPIFMRSIEYKQLNIAARTWYTNQIGQKKSPNSPSVNNSKTVNEKVFRITIALLHLILTRSPKILSISLEKSRDINGIPEFTRSKSTHASLSHLRSLTLRKYSYRYFEAEKQNIAKTFIDMAEVCRNIANLFLNIDGFDEQMETAIISLIHKQRKIQHVILEAYSASPRNIISAIGHDHAASLTRIEFKWSYLNADSLAPLFACQSLTTLVFIECSNIKREIWFPLCDVAQFKLNKLYFMNEENFVFSPYELLPIINMTGEYLTDLVVVAQDALSTVFEPIARWAPNLKNLGCIIDLETLHLAKDMLRGLKKLERLSLRFNGQPFVQSDPLVIQLAQALPQRLVGLNLHFPISALALRRLFEECHAPIEQFGITDLTGLMDEHLKVCIEFAKRQKCLKKVGFGIEASEFLGRFDQRLMEEAKGVFEFVDNVWFDMYGDFSHAEF